MKIQTGKQRITILEGPLPLSVEMEGHMIVFPRGIDPAKALKEAMFAFWETLGPVRIEALNPQEPVETSDLCRCGHRRVAHHVLVRGCSAYVGNSHAQKWCPCRKYQPVKP